MVAGFGAIKSSTRNVNAIKCWRMVNKKALMQVHKADKKGDDGIFLRTRAKQEVRTEVLEDQTKDDASKKVTLTDEEFIEGMEEGMKEACCDLVEFGIIPKRDGGIVPNNMYDRPWEYDVTGSGMVLRSIQGREDETMMGLVGGEANYWATRA